MIFADGKLLASSPVIAKLEAKLSKPVAAVKVDRPVNFAVNNDGGFFPSVGASFTNPATPVHPVNDGNYWYHLSPPNRWTCENSPNETDWLEVEFGAARPIETVKLYFLDDSKESKGKQIKVPTSYDLLYWNGKQWIDIPGQERNCEKPEGHRANVVTFPKLNAEKIRVRFTHKPGSFTLFFNTDPTSRGGVF